MYNILHDPSEVSHDKQRNESSFCESKVFDINCKITFNNYEGIYRDQQYTAATCLEYNLHI